MISYLDKIYLEKLKANEHFIVNKTSKLSRKATHW